MPRRAERDALQRPATGQTRQVMTPHGFLGVEKQAVGAIVRFVKPGP